MWFINLLKVLDVIIIKKFRLGVYINKVGGEGIIVNF